MNHPLILKAVPFAQSGLNEETERGTRMQVVQNPETSLYWGVAIVGVGLMVSLECILVDSPNAEVHGSRKANQT